MILPDFVKNCLNMLENAGFACYAVGGCVRDDLLGLVPHDYDLCTDATPAQIKAIFAREKLVLSGEKHGTVGVITAKGVVEITTFRTETGYQDNRHPDKVAFVHRIEEDLARRDFTINAIAWSPTRGYADPYGGAQDLKNHILRAVGDPDTRFKEDSLRILRGVRFSVRFALSVEENTLFAMISNAGRMENLARERVFDELCKLLPLVHNADLQKFAPIFCAVIPELQSCIHFDQRNPHHIYDLFTHIAVTVENVPATLSLRWAALLHDIGKPNTFTTDAGGIGHFYDHAKNSAALADCILRRLKAPTALRKQVVLLVAQHMCYPPAEKKAIRHRLNRIGEENLKELLLLQAADTIATGTATPEDVAYFPAVQEILQQLQRENTCFTRKDLAINGKDLMAQGYSGKDVGIMLETLLELVINETLPNEKTTLLQYSEEQLP